MRKSMKLKPKGLLLEDNVFYREYITGILNELNYEVLAYSDPTRYRTCHPAQECRKSTPCVDVIVTDNLMPNMTGLDYLESIKRTNCKVPDTHKVLISGSLGDEELAKVERLGCQYFLKLFDLLEFSSWLEDKAELQVDCH